MKNKEAKRGSSSSNGDSDQPKIDIKSILKDIEFLGSSHMTWKQKKGGKPPKKQRLPLSAARLTMKKQKERDEKMLQERALLGRLVGVYSSSTTKVAEKRRPEDRVLKSIEGNFSKGVLNVKHMLKPSTSEASNEKGRHSSGKGKKKKDGKKGHGKRKGGVGGGGGGGRGRKRH